MSGRAVAAPPFPLEVPSRWRLPQEIRRFCVTQPVGAVSAAIIIVLVLVSIFASWVAPYAPDELIRGARLLSPSWSHPFGTDDKGRDISSRIVFGSKISLKAGFGSVAVGVLGGSIVGIVSGYFRGFLDLAVQRLMDAMLSFPALVLAISLTAGLGRGLTTVIIAVGLVILPGANRVVRGATLGVASMPYVEAARSVGASNLRIMCRHILPNVTALIIVLASIAMGFAIIVEASLSFLGLGVSPTAASWGQMLTSGRFLMEDSPWLVLAPGVAITIVVLAFNLLGDALRDYLDPSLRGRN